MGAILALVYRLTYILILQVLNGENLDDIRLEIHSTHAKKKERRRADDNSNYVRVPVPRHWLWEDIIFCYQLTVHDIP